MLEKGRKLQGWSCHVGLKSQAQQQIGCRCNANIKLASLTLRLVHHVQIHANASLWVLGRAMQGINFFIFLERVIACACLMWISCRALTLHWLTLSLHLQVESELKASTAGVSGME